MSGAPRRARKTDANQTMIVDALRMIGVTVEVIENPLDLLCCHKNETFMLEVKTADGRLTKGQVEFMARWPGRVHIVRSVDEAMRAVLGEKVMA